MNQSSVTIIKLGGSIITNKSQYRELNKQNLKKICKVLAQHKEQYIVVHGAGSFGHIIASKYDIANGYKDHSQLGGLATIRRDMNELSNAVTKYLNDAGLEAFSFQTSALVYEKNESDGTIFVQPILKALELGIVPVLSGDVIFTEKKGFTILSGDKLIERLVKKITVKKVIFVSNVDGIFVIDPVTEVSKLSTALSISELENVELAKIKQGDIVDVTGDMAGKYSSIKKIIPFVESVAIVNGNYPERILAALQNSPGVYTLIR